MIALPEDTLAIGVGGNLGGEPAIRERFIRARDALAQLGPVRSAPLYRTAPIGPPQPAFLNTVVRVQLADATADELLHTIRELEVLLGRDRGAETRWGPRLIDLDLLLWGTRQVRTPELEVPHPRLVERRFAIEPLVDLFGEALVIPGSARTLGELARQVRGQVVECLSAW